MKGITSVSKNNINTECYWNNRYLEKSTNHGTSALETIIEWLDRNVEIKDSDNIIDIGSGPKEDGSFLSKIKNTHNSNCYSMDISGEICSSWNGFGVESKKGSLPKIDFPDSFFDIVLCSHVLEHVSMLEESIGEIKRVTKSGGIIIINSPIGIGWGTEPEHVWWFSEKLDFGLGKIIDSFEGNQYMSMVQIYVNMS